MNNMSASGRIWICRVKRIFDKKKNDTSVTTKETILAPERSAIVLTVPTIKMFCERKSEYKPNA